MNSKTLSDIFTPKIISVTPDTLISRTMETMRDNDISCVVVLLDGKPVGIVTERNIVNFAVRQGGKYKDCLSCDLMSTPVVTAHKDMDVFEAHNLFSLRNIRHLVVVDDDQHAIGVVTQSDIVTLLSLESFIDIKTIDEVMSRNVFVLSKDVAINTALEEMAERAVSCIVVVQNEKPIGILTERDIARLLIKYKDLSFLRLEEVMSSSIKTVSKMVSLNTAVDHMRKKHLRRLVVVDESGRIEGLATQSDIVKGLEGKYIERLHEIITEKNVIIQNTARDLAEKSIYLHNILRSSLDYGMIALDLEFKILFFNQGAEKILDLEGKDVINTDGRSMPPWAGEKVLRSAEIINRLKLGIRYEYTHEQEKGVEKQYIHVTASSITDQSNNLIGFLLMVRDITKQTNIERQLYLAQKHLEKRVVKRTRQLEKAMEAAIKTIALTVEMRDPYTSGHQRRVADLAYFMARELGLKKEKVEGVYMAGLIHDIGKIRVPSDILCHTGKLNGAELAILKHHPTTGNSILKGIEFPWPVAEIVLQHHERIDGSGYPYGLHGNDIMIKAKILAVADVVEAMSSHRPYRAALGIDKALEEISNNKGIRYDADSVDVCLNLFEQDDYTFPSSFLCVN
jgi:PAS domain S-box-containing protein/putative nucleotidyltransferase with HDIG domain